MASWRSYLFVPSLKQSMMEKAIHSNADCVIFDLEDAVAASEKDAARDNVREALSLFADKKTIYVRINDVSTSYWEDDLQAAVLHGAHGVVVPKVERVEGVHLVSECIQDTYQSDRFEIIPLIETARGVEFAYEIANADPLITHMAFGSIDFSLDVGCELTPGGQELLYARSRIVIASKAAGIGAPIDAVYPELNNQEGLKREAITAKQLGFASKLVIHPKQIEPVNMIFSPNEEKLAEARRIVEAFEKAEKQGLASIRHNNQFVDYPVYKKAKELLKLLN